MGTRFNDVSYLQKWSDNGTYPRIHNDIFELFMRTFESQSILDLCCATGLLGTRIKEKAFLDVCAIEAEQKNIDRGVEWGIPIPILKLFIERGTLPQFIKWIESNEVTGIVARRCISELFGNTPDNEVDWEWAEIWTNAIADAGVREVWLQGRADQGRSVHCIPDTATEIECLSSRYTVMDTLKETAYLVLK